MKLRAALCTAVAVVCGVVGYEQLARTQAQPPLPYFITDLGTLGGAESRAFGVGENAQTVGSSLLADGATVHAFVTSGTTLKDLGTLRGASSVATDVNRSGAVVGIAQTALGNQKAFLYTAAGGMVSLRTLGGSASDAAAINDRNEIVGSAQTTGNAARRAFIYRDGVMTELQLGSAFGGTNSAATAISSGGDVAGWASTAGNASRRAFLYSGGVTNDLGTLGGESVATALNDSAEVVGYSVKAGARHAFLYTGGSMIDLGTLGGPTSEALGIGEFALQVVGTSDVAGSTTPHAFSYTNGAMVDLNTLLPAGSGWILEAATAVNGSGEIAGYGLINGRRHAFRLTPPVDMAVRAGGMVSQEDSNLPRVGVQVGKTVKFVSTVMVGEGTARNVVFTGTVSGPVEIESVRTYRDSPCSLGTATVSCRIPALGVAAAFEEEMWVTLRVTGPGVFSYTARATADNVHPDGNDSVTEDNIGLALADLTLSSNIVAGGKAVSAKATLTDLAYSGGSVVTITSSNPTVAPVPSTLIVQLPTNFRAFNIVPPVVSQPTTATISATYGKVTISRTLTVVPPALATLSLSGSSLIGSCRTATGKVTLTGSAPASGASVALSTTTIGASSPATVVVPAGASSASFTVTSRAVSTINKGTFTASYGGASKSLSLSVRPIYITGVTLTPTTVVGGSAVSGQATIECAAPAGGLAIALSSTNTAIATPATSSIVVAAGGTKGAFSVTTRKPAATTTLSIRAAAHAVTKAAALTVTP